MGTWTKTMPVAEALIWNQMPRDASKLCAQWEPVLEVTTQRLRHLAEWPYFLGPRRTGSGRTWGAPRAGATLLHILHMPLLEPLATCLRIFCSFHKVIGDADLPMLYSLTLFCTLDTKYLESWQDALPRTWVPGEKEASGLFNQTQGCFLWTPEPWVQKGSTLGLMLCCHRL